MTWLRRFGDLEVGFDASPVSPGRFRYGNTLDSLASVPVTPFGMLEFRFADVLLQEALGTPSDWLESIEARRFRLVSRRPSLFVSKEPWPLRSESRVDQKDESISTG